MPRLTLPEKAFYLGLLWEKAADKHGDVPVTLDQPLATFPHAGTDLTYRSVADLVDDLAARLWHVGIRPTERVAIHKDDNFDIALLAAATARIGAVPVVLSAALSPDVVTQLLNRLAQPWLISDAAKLSGPLSGTDLTGLVRDTVLAGTTAHASLRLLADITDAPRREAVRLHRRQTALITHSSGTTGVNKLMVHNARALFHRLLPQQLIAWPIRKKETVALAMSYVHSRFYHSLGVFLNYGNPLVILTDPDPDTVGPIFTRTRPGLVETHPNNFIQWEDLADAPGAPLSSVRYYSSTFDAIHPRTIQRLLAASRRRRPLLVQLYGQSETGPISGAWYTRKSAAKNDGRDVGFVLPGFIRLRAVDDHGRRVPRGQAGHLELRGRGTIMTYLGEDERYEKQRHDGWWRLGDMGSLHRGGKLRLIDREIDQIDTIDSNLELEDVLMSRLDELLEVIIVPGTDHTPVPVVCTRRDAPLDEERWRTATAGLPAMAAPLHWPFADVPRTSTWKVRRVEITRMLHDGQSPAAPANAT
ncbi:class I adenylate-forming enzyme family protein [Streptomyces sp. AN091965]|uniref:class I adenylate-forming enzyme family protein n=1 Tax=Streptomyces sp. AN091965 TaxID=2927803 RepID=UPI001F6036CC|nr:AMP-binding protein [Streptomyces sp. AN091965]MCI3927763.1 AMP-binding protein [Streptomyces sp. AN091965]